MATCKTCQATIWWATHATTGKMAPLDAQVRADGNCLTMEVDGKLYYSIPKKDELPQHIGKLRTNHWMTCVSPPPRKGGKAA